MPKAGSKRRTKPPPKPGLVIFSDIDGTLFDHYSYTHEPAKAAVRELKRRNVPLVLVSSKTCAEIMQIQDRLGLSTPFVSEHGSAIFWPRSSTPDKPRGAKERNGLWVKELGVPYDKARKHLVDYREAMGLKCEGFGDWTPQQIAHHACLPISAAPLAKKREYHEPFIFDSQVSEADATRHCASMSDNGWRVLKGIRFYHLMGKSDKGKAVRELIRWYKTMDTVKQRTIAFGDSPNDWEMMEECDVAVAVKRPDGKYHPDLRAHKGIRLAGAPGPEGFNRMVLRLLKQLL